MSDKLRNITEQKLKAFSIGAMGRRQLSKRELEEQRKREEEKAAAHAFQEFVETFQEAPINGSSKVWVKAGTYDAGARKEDTREKGKLYKPTSRLQTAADALTTAEKAQAYAKILSNDKKPERLGKKKQTGKSNLESFMEELKQIQEEREERHKYKGQVLAPRTPIEAELDLFVRGDMGSFDNGDPNTTNLYLGNLNPKISEPQLMEIFGHYGPLASIKIMWPRSDEEKARGRNCGFVAYMSRKDGERALKQLNGRNIGGYDMKLGWGKAVIIPPQPIYIPPVLLELGHPPPPSGLPFNAQPEMQDRDVMPKSDEELNAILKRAVVKVVVPNDKNLLMLVHRMVEFVVREGPMFEAMIMNRELHNPQYRFLFENQTPVHIYYRWKMFSILNGDSQREWRTKEFRMFQDGSIWKPPVLTNYTAGMPEELLLSDGIKDPCKGTLSNSQRDRLEDLLRNLTLEKKKIGEVMVYCIDHSEAADEVCECITESLSNDTTLITKKTARFYLVSDILHNCAVKIHKASNYRKVFQQYLETIVTELKKTYDTTESFLQKEGFKVRVLRVLKSWEDVGIYTADVMTKLHDTFLGVEPVEASPSPERHDDDIDGNPLDKASDDETPLDGASLLKSAMMEYNSPPQEEFDIDGEDISANTPSASHGGTGFIKSKWETIDPEQVEAQAMTTSKWDMLEGSQDSRDSNDSNQNDSDKDDKGYSDEYTRNMTEEKRMKLREIEVKAVQYQDELESGQRSLKSGWTVAQQVEHYRRKLYKKAEKESKKDKIVEKTPKREKHKKDYDRSDRSERKDKDYDRSERSERKDYDRSERSERSDRERKEEDRSDDEYYKEHTSRKSKKHARSSSTGSTSKHRSKSRSPPRKRSSKVVISRSPSPPRISSRSRHSPVTTSRSHRSRRGERSPSPISSSTTSRYSPPSSTSRRYSPSPSRLSKHSSSGRIRSRSRSPTSRSERERDRTTVRSRSTSRTRYYSPDSTSTSSSSKKHRHKHKH